MDVHINRSRIRFRLSDSEPFGINSGDLEAFCLRQENPSKPPDFHTSTVEALLKGEPHSSIISMMWQELKVSS